jgi:tRNA (mo5U34)-methyltransferase
VSEPVDVAALSDDELRRLVEARQWYHTFELRPGIVTPGWFDLRALAGELPIPDLTGKRALDIGTFEGFWAYQLESRGAAEVLAIDILDPAAWDWPVGSEDSVVQALEDRKQGGGGFELVSALRESAVSRLELSIYDLSPERVGLFDFVYLGSLLLHLRDPLRALEAVRSVVRLGGQVLFVDAIDVDLAFLHPRRPVAHLDGIGRPWWWKPNPAALKRMVEVTGFTVTRGPVRISLPVGRGQQLGRLTLRRLLTPSGRELLALKRKGDPHAYVLAEPR